MQQAFGPSRELGTHLTQEDIARIASAYDPDNPLMMQRLAGQLKAEKQRAISRETELISGFGAQLGLARPVVETAGSIYETTKARAARLGVRTRDLDVATYAVIMAGRQFRLPLRSRTVIDAARAVAPGMARPTSLHDIFRLQDLLPVHIPTMDVKGWQSAAVRKLSSEGVVNLADIPSILERATKIADCLPPNFKEGHTPAVLAASTLYLAISPERRVPGTELATQDEVAEAADASEYTVREMVSEIRGTDCV